MEFNILIKPLVGDSLKLKVQNVWPIIKLKQLICSLRKNLDISTIVLVYKGTKLEDDNTIVSYNISNNDQLILMINLSLKKAFSLPIGQVKYAEDYEVKVNELIELGHSRDDVIQALQHNNQNFRSALTQLIHGKKRAIDEEVDNEIPDVQNQFQLLIKQPEIQEIKKCINTPKWDQIFNEIQVKNPKLMNLIMANENAFLGIMIEQQTDSKYIEVTPDDLNIVFQLHELQTGLSDRELLQVYYNCNKDPISTINMLKLK